MQLLNGLLQAALLLSSATTVFAASWTFTDATLSVSGRGAGVGSGTKEKLTPSIPLLNPVIIGASDTLKLILTTQDGKSAKRPHQAFLLLEETNSNLDISYPFSVKESGKATISLSFKDLPTQFQHSSNSLSASIVIGSFGSSTALKSQAFTLRPKTDTPQGAAPENPLRYGKLPEIQHVFRSDPRSPPMIISLVFAAAALATVPILLGSWIYLGGNVNHLSKALSDSPVSHAVFLGSIFGVEAVLFLYYTTWNLFQTLPVLGVLGVVALISGSRALTEVQDRRLAGLR